MSTTVKDIGRNPYVWVLSPGTALTAVTLDFFNKEGQSPGFAYYLDVHAVVQYGAADKITELLFGERTAWRGAVSTGTITINSPDLFGGSSGQGGVVGDIIVLDGNPTQMPPEQQELLVGEELPGWRDVLSLYFQNFLWSSLSPYFKSPWVRTERLLKGWDDDTPWYPEKVAIPRYKTTGVALETWDYKWFPEGVGDSGWENEVVDLAGWTTGQDVADVPFTSGTVNFPAETTYSGDPHHRVTMWYRYNFTPASPRDLTLTITCDFPMSVWLNGTKLIDLPVGTQSVIIRKDFIIQGAPNLLAMKTSGGTPSVDGHYLYEDASSHPNNSVGGDYPNDEYVGGTFVSASALATAYAHQIVNGYPYWDDAAWDTSYGLTSDVNGVPYYEHIVIRAYDPTENSWTLGRFSVGAGNLQLAGTPVISNVIVFKAESTLVNDMNAAHMIYQCLTDRSKGMGYPRSDLGDASFRSSADRLFDEGFGLSIIWDQQDSIESFVKLILDHINGVLNLNLQTGLFELKLIRDDVEIEDMLVLNSDNSELESFHRTSWGEIINEVVVKFTDDDQNESSLTVQNLAAIEAQGGVISTTREYLAIRDPQLAARVGERDIALISLPLAKISLTNIDRSAYKLAEGDVFNFVWPEEGIESVPFRILKINKGTLADSGIRIDAIEDVFGLPDSSYVEYQGSGAKDPTAAQVHKVIRHRVVEAPYWDVAHMLSAPAIVDLGDDYAFGQSMASYGSTGYALNYSLWYSDTGLLPSYVKSNTANLTTTMELMVGINSTETTLTFDNDADFSKIDNSSYGYLGNEVVRLKSLDMMTGVGVIERALLDTVPQPHASGEMLFFASASDGVDRVVRSGGDAVFYKMLPRAPSSELTLDAADTDQITFVNRANLPYPPGNIRVNDEYRPTSILENLAKVRWSHRNRITQTVELVQQTDGNVTPEVGNMYTFKVYQKLPGDVDFTLVDTVVTALDGVDAAGTGGAYAEFTPIGGGATDCRIEIYAEVDGRVSYQTQVLEMTVTDLSRAFTSENGFTFITEDGNRMMTE